MLIDKKGRVVNPGHLPKSRAKREAALAELCEVQAVPHKGKAYSLGERARLVQK